MEFFGGRALRNGKEVGARSGLTPPPSASGTTAYERGIATAGNAPIRTMAIEIAWGWLRLQPDSALTQWYQQRCGHGSRRRRRRGMVALAHKLLMALWRCVETGFVPDGAALKAAVHLYKLCQRPVRRSSLCSIPIADGKDAEEILGSTAYLHPQGQGDKSLPRKPSMGRRR